MHPLDGCFTKLARAKEHLHGLDCALDEFLRSRFYRIDQEPDGETGQDILRYRELIPIPVQWGVVAGEILYDARSALDHLAWQLAVLHGSPPPRDTEFPIFLERDRFKAKGFRKIRGMSSEIQLAIERLQPYHRQDLYEWGEGENRRQFTLKPDDPEQHPLWLLHALCNIDKHRVLHVGAARIVGATYWEEAVKGSVDFKEVLTRFRPLEAGAEVGRVRPRPDGSRARVDADFHLDVAVSFDEGTPAAGDHYTVILQYILEGVERLIRSFTTVFH